MISDYEYDIFISYRHNDNQSGWVTEFVKDLQKELSATIKYPVSVYFDSNPHDGLLETHNVAKSLEGKLKCLIFIPILSQTYCDPKSFAWQHEFVAFNRLAKEDQFGREIKLSNGNVTSRILPAKIHDIDGEDKNLLESETGSVLRAIDFIYKEPGVNRSLKPSDIKSENINKTEYGNQINKIANAVKEIITAVKNPTLKTELPTNRTHAVQKEVSKKSVMVLPFVNISNDPEQEYFSDGLTEEVITDLSHIHDLVVISRSSAMTFKGTSKKIREIANEINVRYVLEGSVRKSGNNVRITAQLIDAETDAHLWAEKYTGILEDIFEVQGKVSRSIADTLKIKLTSHEQHLQQSRPIDNAYAYDLFLKAREQVYKFDLESLQNAKTYVEKGIELIGENNTLMATLAYIHMWLANLGVDHAQNLATGDALSKKVLQKDPECPEANVAQGLLSMLVHRIDSRTIEFFKRVLLKWPNDFDANLWLGFTYGLLGKKQVAVPYLKHLSLTDPLNPLVHLVGAVVDFFDGEFESAFDRFHHIIKTFKIDKSNMLWVILASVYTGRKTETIEWNRKNRLMSTGVFLTITEIFIPAFDRNIAGIDELVASEGFREWAMKDAQYAQHVSAAYAIAGDNDQAFWWLNHAYTKGFINYPFIAMHDPFIVKLRKEQGFQDWLKKVKEEWENFK